MTLAVVIICAVMLVVGVVLAAIRVERGPSMLDRTMALDTVTSCLIGVLALVAAWSRRGDIVPILAVLALVGFIGSVTIARFASVEPEGEGRVLSPAEVARIDAERRAREEAELRESDPEHHGGTAPGEVMR